MEEVLNNQWFIKPQVSLKRKVLPNGTQKEVLEKELFLNNLVEILASVIEPETGE